MTAWFLPALVAVMALACLLGFAGIAALLLGARADGPP